MRWLTEVHCKAPEMSTLKVLPRHYTEWAAVRQLKGAALAVHADVNKVSGVQGQPRKVLVTGLVVKSWGGGGSS